MARLLLALPFSLLASLAIFSFMAWMVDNGVNVPAQQHEPLLFNMVMVEEDQALKRRQRAVPEQPKSPEIPKHIPISTEVSVEQASQMTQIMDLGFNTAIEGLVITTPQLGDFNVSQQALPLYRVEPRYPNRAIKRKLEGYVIMRFTIDPTGKPTDIQIIESNPPRIFEREATRALRQWKYQPNVENGESVAQVGQTVRLEFKLSK